MAGPLEPHFAEVSFGSRVPPELLSALRGNDFFYGVSESLIDDFVGAFRMACLPSLTTLYRRKSASTHVFLILDGAVRIQYSNLENDGAVQILHKGRFTGEVSLMPALQRLHQGTATFAEPTVLCWARAVDITALLCRTPQVAINIAHSLHARVGGALRTIDSVHIG